MEYSPYICHNNQKKEDMATSSKDIEILWKRYSDEGIKRGVSHQSSVR
jgi:phage-related protein